MEFGFDHFIDCRDIEVIEGSVVKDIPRSIEDDTQDFGLETMKAFNVV